MFTLASVKHSLLASSRSETLTAGLETETRLRQNICREETQNRRSAADKIGSEEDEESHQQEVQRAEVGAGDEMSVENIPSRFVLAQTLKNT